MALLAASCAFAPPKALNTEWREAASPFRGQQLWHAAPDWQSVRLGLGHVEKSFVHQSGGRPEPLMLDDWAKFVSANHQPPAGALEAADSDKFFDFLPTFQGAAVPGGSELSFRTACFGWVTVGARLNGATADVTFRANQSSGVGCTDLFLLTTAKSVHLQSVSAIARRHEVTWSGLSAVELDDIRANGVRLFHMPEALKGTVVSAFETALLFLEPQLFKRVTKAAAERNIQFLKDHAPGSLAPHAFEERAVTDVVPDEADIADGDQLCILRLDGLDPLINWGTGGECGHTVMALRFDGELHIIESQSKSGYWPKDFVQRNPYRQWIAWAKQADYNVLHLRLSAAARAKFNETATRLTFEQQYEGLLYGFPNMLWGWFDGPTGNFPPPADVHLFATLFSVLDPLISNATGAGTPSLWNGAIAQRLGLAPSPQLTTAGLLATARARNVSFGQLLRMPEQDSWRYPLPASACGRKAGCDGPAQVCNVFVCKMWRAGGLFDASFNCGEQTPLDTYGMQIFDTAPPLSAACRAADPMNTAYCQILGKYRLILPHFSTVAPRAHMAEACPSQAPNYTHRFDPAVYNSC